MKSPRLFRNFSSLPHLNFRSSSRLQLEHTLHSLESRLITTPQAAKSIFETTLFSLLLLLLK
jgi:hypothetical protein